MSKQQLETLIEKHHFYFSLNQQLVFIGGDWYDVKAVEKLLGRGLR